jgi:hypothetical protein
VVWSPSYFAAPCGGAPQTIIKQYVENQRGVRHDGTPRGPDIIGAAIPRLKTGACAN